MKLFDIVLILQLFVLLNPLSSFPVLLSSYKNKLNVKHIAASSVIIALIIALIITILGPYLFNLFGININSFKVAGGIILLLLGLDTIQYKEQKKSIDRTDSLISIIATPLLTGPATISFITIKTLEIGRTPVLFNILFSFILVGVVFMFFSFSIAKINAKIIDITSKILGLFLTAVAIELITSGLHGLLSI